MADRYWVGGTANWDTTAGTKWSTTSGGPGGASVPTSADDVYFDAASGTVTVTLSGTLNCKSVNCTGFAGTLAGTSGFLQVYGSITLNPTMGYTYAGIIDFYASATITSAGKPIRRFRVPSGTAYIINLADALTMATGDGRMEFTGNCTFNTNDYTITAGSLSTSGTGSVINLGSSLITLRGNAGVVLNLASASTFNAGTSTIIFATSGATSLLSAAPINLNNVEIRGTATSLSTTTLDGICTYNNLTIATPANNDRLVRITKPQTVNGQFTVDNAQAIPKVLFITGFSGTGLSYPLTLNGSVSGIIDISFKDIIVQGSAAPLTGTRLGDLGGCSGIIFTAPKNVYFEVPVNSGTLSWSTSTAWALTPGEPTSSANYPLPQDTATFYKNYGSTTFRLDSNYYIPSINASAATITFSRSGGNALLDSQAFYGSELTLGAGVSFDGNTTSLNFAGRNKTCIITSAGKTLPFDIIVDNFGGGVELGDALTLNNRTITITSGTFDTKNFTLTTSSNLGGITTTSSLPKVINLGSSTVTIGNILTLQTEISDNLIVNAGTSQLNIVGAFFGGMTYNFGNQRFYNVNITSLSTVDPVTITNGSIFNNLTLTSSSNGGISPVRLNSPSVTIEGTLSIQGISEIRRVFLYNISADTSTSIIANAIQAQHADFRNINLQGAAANTLINTAGDCTGNTGIQFPAPKTVYWNLAGTKNWEDNAWATSSGGTPSLENFPLAHDNIVFDNAGAAGTITLSSCFNIGGINCSDRSLSVTLTFNSSQENIMIYKDVIFSSSVTFGSSGGTLVDFSGSNSQIISFNGASGVFNAVRIFKRNTAQAELGSAMSGSTLVVSSGIFNTNSYNVTLLRFTGNTGITLKLGDSIFTLTDTGTIWNPTSSVTFEGMPEIILTNTGTSDRTFAGQGFAYNKLTIGGSTGTSTTTITGNNFFTELASTKTVAHTIALGSTLQTFGKWSVTGTAGNVVTVTGTGTSHVIAGPRTEGIDYLAMGSIGFSTSASTVSSGEFYAGANSTGTHATIIKTAAPTARTLYWVGGTGNWSDTTKWSLESGGSGGQSVPTSVDDVIFDANSSVSSYTMTINVLARCKSFTMSGPATGTVTWAGSSSPIIHGNLTLAATGVARASSAIIILSGAQNTTNILTNNAVFVNASIHVSGFNTTWQLSSALSGSLTVRAGNFDTQGYGISGGIAEITSSGYIPRSIYLRNSTIVLAGNITFNRSFNLVFDAGTSTIICNFSTGTIIANPGVTFYNFIFDGTGSTLVQKNITGENTFNNLEFKGITQNFGGPLGPNVFSFANNQTVLGQLITTDTRAWGGVWLRSSVLGTPRTITIQSANIQNTIFTDINVQGAAAPISGTNIGDGKGNSNITFTAPKTLYWNKPTGNSSLYGRDCWALTPGGAVSEDNAPLPQDTLIISNTGLNSGASINAAGTNQIFGTFDMSQRTLPFTFSGSSFVWQILGDFILSSAVTIIPTTNVLLFTGRTTQLLTTAGKTLQTISTVSPGGSVVLQDAIAGPTIIGLLAGTFNANNYNVGASRVEFTSSYLTTDTSQSKTLAMGSGTWIISQSGTIVWSADTASNLSVTGTATIKFTHPSSKTFAGGNLDYSGITLDQASTGTGTLLITGNNTFKNITNTSKSIGPQIISLVATTQRVEKFEAVGESGRLLTIQGTGPSTPATLILTGSTKPNLDYLNISNVRAYPTTETWYAGNNSVNLGSLGFEFTTAPEPPAAQQNQNFFMLF